MSQDEHKASAVSTVMIDNDVTRVTEWRFPKRGDSTGWHKHEYDYTVVPMLDGVLEIDTVNGRTTSVLKKGVAYFRNAGVEHDVINGNDFEFSFVEIEFLR